MKTNRKKNILTGMLLIAMFLLLSSGTATTKANGASIVNYGKPVVMIDVSKTSFDSSYTKFQTLLGVWGFDVVWNNDTVTGAMLSGVDAVVVPAMANNYTAAELSAFKSWFDGGNKGLWVSGDSDFAGDGNWSLNGNELLNEVGSSIYIEGGAVESENNFGAAYRVSANLYNTTGPNSKYLTSNLPYQGTDANAAFHGPAAVIGKDAGGNYVDLEHHYLPNVEWVAQTQNGTIVLTVANATVAGAQAHPNNAEGPMTLMALQHSAGGASSSKIIVTGSDIFSTYKNQLNDLGEFEIPHNDIYLVYNTMQWLTTTTNNRFNGASGSRATVFIDVSNTNYDSDYLKFKNQLIGWGFNVIWNNDTLTTNSLTGVDIVVVPAMATNYSSTEAGYLKTWFDTGNKGIWVSGDSDFGGDGNWSLNGNQLLSNLGSSIYIEGGAVESENNFGAAYRVSANLYNTTGPNSKFLTLGLPYQGTDAYASFHGPAAVIGKDAGGNYVDLEHHNLPNVEWVAQTQNGTIVLTAANATVQGAQAHLNNAEGPMTVMALQHSAGVGNTGKIVVTGSDIFSMYKSQFNDPGEFEIPQNDYYLVYNTMQWFAGRYVDTHPTVMVEVSKTSFDSSYTKFSDALKGWGYNVVWNNATVTASLLNGVDVVVVPAMAKNYTTAELNALATWYGAGDKGLWVSGDSDFAGDGNWSVNGNQFLAKMNSSIYIEGGAIESDINFGAAYRVGGNLLNTVDSNSNLITSRVPLTGTDALTSFHGPAAVIGKDSGGNYVDLETHSLPNVEWVVRTSNATIVLTASNATVQGAQAHVNNQEGNFTLMALQTSVGFSGTSKLVVTGSDIFSIYKDQFNPTGEFETPQDDYYIVRNTMNWFAPILSTPVLPHVYITSPVNNAKFDGTFELTWDISNFHSDSFVFSILVDDGVETTTQGFSVELDLASGEHTIEVHAETLEGFGVTSLPLTVTVDKDAPTVTLSSTTVTNGGSTTSTGFAISYAISDGSGTGIASYTITLDGSSIKTGDGSSATGTVTLSNLAVGSHTVKATAQDMVGNSADKTFTFTVTAPSSTTSTGNAPGFELIFIFLTIPVLMLIRSQKRKYN